MGPFSNGLGLLLSRAGSDLLQDSLILCGPNYCQVGAHALRNICLDFSWKLLNLLQVREYRLPEASEDEDIMS
jgi:hypothetical protein